MTKNKIVSRWGDAELDDNQYITIPGFILRHYSKFMHEGEIVGLTSDEFQVFTHIMSFKYDVAGAEAAPSLQTVADQTGKHISSVRRTVKRLKTKKALLIEHRPGKPSAYNFGELVRQCRAFEALANASASADARTTPSADARTPLAQTLAEELDLEVKKKNDGVQKPKTQHNLMFEAICGVFGYDWRKITASKRGQVNVSAKQLLEAGATPSDIPGLFGYCHQKFDNFGPVAFASNWDDFKAKRNGNHAKPTTAFVFNPSAPAHVCNDGMVIDHAGKSLQCPVCAGEVMHG